MRVLVVHNLKRGGAWRRLQEQTARLDADVLELTLGTAMPVTSNPRVIPFRERAPHVRRSMRPPLRYGDAAALARAWRDASTAARSLQADVVFANPCQFLQAPPVLLARSVPTLYFCDEPRRVDYEAETAATRNPRTRILYAALYAYERRLDAAGVRRAGSLATNSRFSARRLHEVYGVTAAVLPMGVAETFRTGPLDARREDVVLSVGMLTSAKGHDLVIEATARSQAMRRVVVVSPRPDQHLQLRLEELATRLGVALDVRVGISDLELRNEYARARVTAYLARGEPFGLAALEAQACGCPVVVAADGGLQEAMIDGVTGIAVERDPEHAARAIDQLCEPERSRSAQDAAAAFGRSWSWERSAQALHELLSAVARPA